MARTVPDQKRFDVFAKALGRKVGRAARLSAITSTHLTLLESRGIRQKFDEYGYADKDIQGFQKGLERCLTNKAQRHAGKVAVNQEAPLRWMTYRGSVRMIAVDIMESDWLTTQRGLIEDYTKSQFGVLPPLQTFDPHITLGGIQRAYITPEIGQDPNRLLPDTGAPLQQITLNGLEVYLGLIHGSKPTYK